jgi:hypothetical protein
MLLVPSPTKLKREELMTVNMRVLALCVLASGLFGCEAKEQRESPRANASRGSYDFALPPDASNATRTSVGKSEQIAFVVQRKYPEFAFTAEVLSRLSSDGWKSCLSSSDDWSSFVDAASGATTRVHQKIIHFRKGDTVLVLAGRYITPLPAGTSVHTPAPPASDQQMGNVLALTGSSTELEEVLKPFNARC